MYQFKIIYIYIYIFVKESFIQKIIIICYMRFQKYLYIFIMPNRNLLHWNSYVSTAKFETCKRHKQKNVLSKIYLLYNSTPKTVSTYLKLSSRIDDPKTQYDNALMLLVFGGRGVLFNITWSRSIQRKLI
jgi:hypothetical protein